MLNEALTPRQQRGLVLAGTVTIRRRSGMFEVPSQTNSGASYIVAKVLDEYHCTCPDYELTGCIARHFVLKLRDRRHFCFIRSTTRTQHEQTAIRVVEFYLKDVSVPFLMR